jgi:hypothetical protein
LLFADFWFFAGFLFFVDLCSLLIFGFLLIFCMCLLHTLQVLGSVEDERTFSNVAFLKNKLRNRLTEHLPLVTTMFAQKHYTLTSFPYKEVVSDWRGLKPKRGRYALGV